MRYVYLMMLLYFGLSEARGQLPCAITDFVAEPVECGGGQFWFEIDFNVNNPISENFRVRVNGVWVDTFAYDDLPVVVGPFATGSNYNLAVRDMSTSTVCVAEFVAGTVACGGGDCSITNIDVSDVICNTEGATYTLTLDFDYENNTNNFFDVWAGETYVGYFEYAALPVVIMNFPISGNPWEVIKVNDNDNPECFDIAEFAAPDCGGGIPCSIYDMTFETDCVDNTFYITLDFEVAEPASDSFTIHGNGNNYGTFAYDDVPVTLGPFEANATAYEFVASDASMESCHDFVDVGVVNCNGDCIINELEVTEVECNENNETYTLVLDFEHDNTTNAMFDVWSGMTLIGTFTYESLPVVIENFPISGNPFEVLSVTDNDNPACFGIIEFAALDCGGGACAISSVVVYDIQCNEDQSSYTLNLNFAHENTSPGFSIYSGLTNIGTFLYSQLPLTLENVPMSGQATEVLVVLDGVTITCFGAASFPALSCTPTQDLTTSKTYLAGVGHVVRLVNAPDNGQYQWYNTLGQAIPMSNDAMYVWNFDGMPSGLYLLTVTDQENRTNILKWVKM